MGKIELLAPAGSLDSLKAAIENGANAVYLGGKSFNARQSANNFDQQELEKAVEFAHERDVKIYVTLNTLLANEEINEFIDYIYELVKAQVDAFIVQDLGVASLIKQVLPDFPLHASTQMTVHNSKGVNYMENLGFKRVVLAREVSLENIKLIKQNSHIEIETFVHGALCVAYSGQCLMSSLIGGRSGNRGKCAQPCRLKYSLIDRNKNLVIDTNDSGEHLLSTKDIKTIEHIPKLIEAGINSFKIEGRMKRPEYVAIVIKNYRKALDNYYEGLNEFRVEEKQEKELEQIFNREFTSAYYFGNEGKNLMSLKRPNNRGLLIGRITQVNNERVQIKLKESLNVGDGYEIWVTKGGRIASKVNEIYYNGNKILKAVSGQEIEIIIKQGIPRVGDRVFKTFDVELMKEATESYSSNREIRKISLYLDINISEGKVMEVSASDEEGYHVFTRGEYLAQKAIKIPVTRDLLFKQFERLGNTPFELASLDVNIDGDLMVPISEMNKIRREIVDNLLSQRNNKYKKEILPYNDYEERVNNLISSIPPQEVKYDKTKLSIVVSNSASVKAAVDEEVDQVYFNWYGLKNHETFSFKNLQHDIDYCHKKRIKAILRLPTYIHEKDFNDFAEVVAKLKKYQFDGVLVGNMGVLQLVKEQEWENILADYTLNIFNDLTIKHLLESEVVQITLSPELTLGQINNFAYKGNMPLEAIVHGNFPLMTSEYCVVGAIKGNKTSTNFCSNACNKGNFGLKDRMNFIFPVEMDDKCRMIVYNSKPLSLYKDIKSLLSSGIDVFRIEALKESPEWIRKVTKIYRETINEWTKNKGKFEVKDKNISELSKLEPEGYTSGHYFRGVL
ncbi:putative protease [Desulfonispora thiosulfatigenes DSM 11270]|uniref:Putative protease n=1 Tax=Desulfonispora thiosulfatigenes DSM 11270 TaxID=656914 RepID=A0A1W1VRJ9_DESTI|nr:U32 family peptidase [Desulfonispora thiosulfatigenes]SMB95966.1 putative protease [Desulfonispora thiosulfatigenes DSM 11270]